MTADFDVILNFNSATPVKTGAEFKAGDKGFTINMTVRELDPTGMTPKIAFYRANGTSVESGAVTNVGNIFSYTLLGNELAVPGVVVADLKFYDGDDQRISSASFIFTAIADTLDGLGGGTESYSDELEQLSAEFQDTLDDYIDAFGNTAPINPRGDYDNTATYEPRDMVYDSNTGTSWVCKQQSTGNAPGSPSAYWQKLVNSSGSANLGDLADVDTTGASSGQLLGFDGADWGPVNAPAGSFSGLSDVNVSTPSDGQVATYDGTSQKWKNKAIPAGSFAGLTDVDTTGVTDGQVATYDGTSQKWKPSTPASGGGSNPNLLMNGWFTVNQRGFTSVSSPQNYTYTADRWAALNIQGASTVTVNSSGITLSGAQVVVRQFLEDIPAPGETLTLSVKTQDGSIYSATCVSPTSKPAANTDYATVTLTNGSVVFAYNKNRDRFMVQLYNAGANSVAVRAVKLEKGLVSTLANDGAPDYTTELLKCQRYYVRYTGAQNTAFAMGTVRGADNARCLILLSVPLRDTPTLTASGSFKFVQDNDSSSLSVSSIGLSPTLLNVMNIYLMFTGGTAGYTGRLLADSSGAYIEFSAEL